MCPSTVTLYVYCMSTVCQKRGKQTIWSECFGSGAPTLAAVFLYYGPLYMFMLASIAMDNPFRFCIPDRANVDS